MIETVVMCDGCGNKIDTKTDYAYAGYLQLTKVAKAARGPAVFSMNDGDPMEPKHFCGVNCVGVWYNEKI